MAKIYWDKGHGGSDPGALGNGLKEKDVVAKIVDYAMEYINDNYAGVSQKTSRTGDQTRSLAYRTNDANNWGADILVSVHNNAFNGSAEGFESYVYPGVGSNTKELQDCIHGELVKVVGTVDRGQKQANFHMLRESAMLAVLTENLFIDASEGKRLKDNSFLKKIGVAHAKGAAKFLGLKKRTKPQQKKSGDNYTVKKGDTLWGIAKANDTTVAVLKQMNGLKDDLIHPGEKIKLPSGSRPEYYTIEKGDSFWKLEERFNLKRDSIQKLNPDIKPRYLQIGQRIRIK